MIFCLVNIVICDVFVVVVHVIVQIFVEKPVMIFDVNPRLTMKAQRQKDLFLIIELFKFEKKL